LARIPLLSSAEGLSPEQRAVFDAVVAGRRGKVQGPLMAALHKPELADKWQQLGEVLRYRTSLPPRLSELAILVTARAWSCQLEWYLHEGFAREVGLEPAIIDAVRLGQRPDSSDEDVLIVYDYCHELQRDKFVSEPTYQRALQRLKTVGVVELTALSGYYTMVAMTLNAHEFPLPEEAERALGPVEA
jgi:4-carboxymuconolactone decarboxylase